MEVLEDEEWPSKKEWNMNSINIHNKGNERATSTMSIKKSQHNRERKHVKLWQGKKIKEKMKIHSKKKK